MFDSEMGVCNSSETDIIIKSYFDRSLGERCLVNPQEYSYWCGYTDQEQEDTWLNVNNNQPLQRKDTLWWKAQPNGREHQNCLEANYYAKLNSTHWNDNYCDSDICYFCAFRVRPTFTLRGMSFCLTQHFDQQYKWTETLQDDKYVLRGLQGSRITWTESNKTWSISSRFKRGPGQLYLQYSDNVYPGGLQQWQPDLDCGQGNTQKGELPQAGQTELLKLSVIYLALP